MGEAERDEPPQRWDTGRVEAFSDGVFAIAITLLVLEIGSNRVTSSTWAARSWTSGPRTWPSSRAS